MGGVRRDEGFSLLEVMFASMIAFFVLTALFGVLVSSTGQGRIATMDTIATDLGQLVLEQARALPYDSIGTTNAVGVDAVLGSLAASETTTFQNSTFDVFRDVTWVRDALGSQVTGDYKRLTVRVSWRGGHTTTLVTFIRDHTAKPIISPIITTFQSPTGQTLYLDNEDTLAYDASTGTTSGPRAVLASASVPATIGTITRLEIRVNGQLACDPWTGSVRSTDRLWPTPSGWFVDLKSDAASATPLFHEGYNVITFWAYSSNMGFASVPYDVIVDNEPPVFPGDATFQLLQPELNRDRFNSTLNMLFTPANDGTSTAVTKYETAISQAGGSYTAFPPPREMGIGATSTLTTDAPAGFIPAPFTVYGVQLTALSELDRRSSPLGSNLMATAPRLNGICFNAATIGNVMKYWYRLSISPPQPTATGLASLLGGTKVEYHMWRRSAVGYTYLGKDNLVGASEEPLTVGTDLTAPTEFFADQQYLYYYQAEARIMNGTTPVMSIWSNVIGPPLDPKTGKVAPPPKGGPNAGRPVNWQL